MASPTFINVYIKKVPSRSCWNVHLADTESEEEDLELSDFLECPQH